MPPALRIQIVYVSETFTKLTGYSENEILGRNCRFLQSPDGHVDRGSYRKYTDNTVIRQVRESVQRREECQYTLINYKKTGEVDGNYNVNYCIADSLTARPGDDAETFSEEISDLLAPAHSPLAAPMVPEMPELLHNFVESGVGDFFHILSLRGLILYASPQASKKVLEYGADELMGHPLSEFVHPADLVSVMRELRTTTPGDGVNIICRFRRKFSGYIYMEINGHIYEGESGKRTKCFIMAGREKFVGVLSARDVLIPKPETAETWAKFSPQGLVLYICPNCVELFGLYQEDLLVKSILDFVDDADQQRLRDALRHASAQRSVQSIQCRITGKRSSLPALFRFYSEGDRLGRTILCQIRTVGEDAAADESSETLGAEYENLYEDGNLFDVMGEVRVTSLHYELNQLRIQNKRLREELDSLVVPAKKKSKSRPEPGMQCAQCHTTYSPEWRKGPDNQRNLCNACGLRFAKGLRKSS
ncbi:blue light receptor [Borealophlyctis nickersoniae]|nr:blue light receptor [Borealophlyctis nickersoniae]